MATITSALAIEIIGMGFGFFSSVTLLLWSLKLGPLHRSLAKLDTIEDGSPVAEVGHLLTGKLRKQVAEVLEKETAYLAISAVLLGLSFLCGLSSKLV